MRAARAGSRGAAGFEQTMLCECADALGGRLRIGAGGIETRVATAAVAADSHVGHLDPGA